MTADIDFGAVRLYTDWVKIHVMLGGEHRNPIAVQRGDLDYKVITKPAGINFVANTTDERALRHLREIPRLLQKDRPGTPDSLDLAEITPQTLR